MASEWRDRTSYSQGERAAERVPHCWVLGEHPHEVKVHRLHGCDGWFLTVHALDIDTWPLRAGDISAAQAEAIGATTVALDRFNSAMVAVLSAPARADEDRS